MKPIVVVGSLNIDLVVTAERYPSPGETLIGNSFEIFHGGKGGNQAAAIGRLGHPVTMIGKIGTDPFSANLLAHLNNVGVDTAGISQIDGSCGVAVIHRIKSGENSIVVVPGANHELCPSDMDSYQDVIAAAGMVLTQLETPLDTLEALCRMTSAAKVALMLDPAPAQSLTSSILEAADWVTPNEVEARHLTGIAIGDNFDEGIHLQVEALLEMGAKNVLLKLGERGVLLAMSSGILERIPSWRVNVADTTGAGDVFNGAFATELLHGRTALEAARFACTAAALSVTHPGTDSMPTRDEVHEFLRERSNE